MVDRGLRSKALRITLAALGIGTLVSIAVFAANPSKAVDHSILYCKEIERSGLYEQCQDVVVLQVQGSMARVYSKPERLVLSVRLSNVFNAEATLSKTPLKRGARVAIASSLLWNSSKLGFSTLCEVHSALDATALSNTHPKMQKISVDCGNRANESIHKELVYRLERYSKKNPDI